MLVATGDGVAAATVAMFMYVPVMPLEGKAPTWVCQLSYLLTREAFRSQRIAWTLMDQAERAQAPDGSLPIFTLEALSSAPVSVESYKKRGFTKWRASGDKETTSGLGKVQVSYLRKMPYSGQSVEAARDTQREEDMGCRSAETSTQ
jgi:GNAT superfamily N-acetyltransferase